MPNALFDKGRQSFAEGLIAWLTDDIRAILIDTALYTVNLATHDFLDDIPVGARVSVSPSFTSKTTTDGILDAADPTFSAVSGATVEALVIYKHTGVDATARLLAYLDTAAGLVLTPNGGNVTCTFDNGSNKICKL